jgi:anti-anti-sigma factor
MSYVIEVIKPSGILDGTKAHQFREKISETIEAGAQIILVDFTNVTFMDSSGLGTLVMSLKTIQSAGAKLFLCSINEQIKMLFELTGMDSFFKIFPSQEEFEKHINKIEQ